MDLAFTNNQDFVLIFNVAPWASVYPLPLCSFLMNMRAAATDVSPIYAWRSALPSPWAGGSISYDGASQLMTISADYADMLKLNAGNYVWDLQMTYNDLVKVLVGGKIVIYTGVSR